MNIPSRLNPTLLGTALRGRNIATLSRSAKLFWSARLLNPPADPSAISIGDHSLFRGKLFVFAHGGRISIGRECYIGDGTRSWSSARVTIADHVLIAQNVSIMDNLTHPLNPVARRRHFESFRTDAHPTAIDLGDRPIVIEYDAWIGARAIILRGVTIGREAVIAAGAVVTRDVPPRTIVARNPATVIRQLDDGE